LPYSIVRRSNETCTRVYTDGHSAHRSLMFVLNALDGLKTYRFADGPLRKLDALGDTLPYGRP
jgi:hypothetical protein